MTIKETFFKYFGCRLEPHVKIWQFFFFQFKMYEIKVNKVMSEHFKINQLD
jgi:hypothetical protein